MGSTILLIIGWGLYFAIEDPDNMTNEEIMLYGLGGLLVGAWGGILVTMIYYEIWPKKLV